METTRPSLLIRVRNRQDQAAWYEFDSIYRPMLLRFGLARGLNANEAEEVAQQCLAAMTQYIEGFDYDPAKGRFKGWLRTMVHNRIRNLLRDHREGQADSQDFKRSQDREQSPDELFDKVWRQEHLKHCLRLIQKEVEESTFKVFVACVIEEQPVEKICGAFGMTANQVHAIKSRMLKRIRQRMADILGPEE
ncbi:MAG TPA: sigma-70 family RNA polymerase sigma factor [Phycisphaerae bacterium]|nr:sigma-70 family RNA polymerase sigma factor [Phycisphaerae bacterium]